MEGSAKSAAPNRQLLPLSQVCAPGLPLLAQILPHAPSATSGLTYAPSRRTVTAYFDRPTLRWNAACLPNQLHSNCEVN